MIECTLDWIEKVNKKFDIKPDKVLDIGSLDSNGSPRSLFFNSAYLGIDIKEGKGVDEIVSAYDLEKRFRVDYFDVVLCLYTLEHLRCFWEVLDGIDYVLIPKGYFYLSVPTFEYPKHECGYEDYWRFSERSIREVIMKGYDIVSLEVGKSRFGKYPVINCLGKKR